jgi:hypothetical protein
MRSERLSLLMCALAVAAAMAWPSDAALATPIWSEDFSGSADLSSGNWHSNITYNSDPASIGTWDTSGGYAASNSSPAGSVGYTAANAQRMFTSAEKAAFGSLYDSASDTIGGGNVSGDVYVRFDAEIASTQDAAYAAGFGWFQLHRGSALTVEELNAGSSGNNALNVGKEWGTTGFSGIVATPGTGDGWNHFTLNPSGTVNSSVHTFVMKISYAAGAADSVSLYLDPLVAAESGQPSSLITTLTGVGDLSFDSFVLRCGNQATNWNFDNVKFGAFFADVTAVPEPSMVTLIALGVFGLIAYAWKKRR